MMNPENVPINPELPNLEDTVANIEKNLQLLVKYAFVLVNLYYFFQGIVLTAVSQVSSPKCHQRYFFFVLSIIPFFLNGLPLIYVGRKYVKAKIEKDRYNLRREELRNAQNNQNGGQQREEMRNAQNQNDGQQPAPAVAARATTDGYRKGWYYFALIGAVILLAVFNGVVLFGCNSLLCENTPPSTVNYDGECFKVCNNGNKCLNICTQQ